MAINARETQTPPALEAPAWLGVSIRNRIVVLACVISVIAVATLNVLLVTRSSELALDAAGEVLEDETRLIAQHVQSAYDEMATDTFVLARVPAIREALREAAAGASDTDFDASDRREPRVRAASGFTSLLGVRTHYTQIRLIGADAEAREIVRVNRRGGRLVTVPPGALQSKAEEPYMRVVHAGRFTDPYFSEVTYNREQGRVQLPRVPTLRVVTPVFGDDGAIAGWLVINADYRRFLSRRVETLRPRHDMLIIDERGDYLEFDAESGARAFHMHDDATHSALWSMSRRFADEPAVDAATETLPGEAMLVDDARVAYAVRQDIENANADAHITIVLSAPKAALFGDAWKARRDGVVTALILVFATALGTAWAAGKLTEPLEKLTAMLKRGAIDEVRTALPTERNDEAGALATAFQGLIKRLDDNQARLRAVFNTVVDGIITIDERGVIETINPAACALFGYMPEEVIGANVSILMPESYRRDHDAHLQRYLDTGERRIIGFGRQLTGLRRSGATFPLELSVSESVVNGRRLFTGVVRDITQRVAYERELDLRRLEAESANIAKSQFLASMSHEIRTPMNGVIGMAYALGATDLNDKQRELLAVISESGDALIRVINDILDLSKIEAGQLDIETTTFSVADVVKSVGALFTPKAAEKGVGFSATVDEAARGLVLGDPTRVRQVLSNLISNAVKFTTQGAVTVSVSVKPDDDGKPPMYVFAVHDTGVGVTPEFIDSLFTPFTQQDASTTRKFGGTGLGLAICRRLCELMGGWIEAESTLGEGSTFRFGVPLPVADETAADAEPAGSRSAPLAAAKRARPLRVLAVDDSPSNRLLLETLLQPIGAHVTSAQDGADALDKWEHGQFDVVLMDVQMPVMDGLEATRAIRKREDGSARTPIIILTADVFSHQVREHLAAGADAHVSKPIKGPALFVAIERVLAPAPPCEDRSDVA